MVPETESPRLADRLSSLANDACLPINGGNCLGYCNYEARVRVNPFPFIDREPGNIAFLAQSGSVFSAITNSNPRVGLNIAVSTGRELSTSVADYMDYVLDLDSTKAVGLFLETVRDPEGFVAALQKAAARDIPVVALKTGRTEVAARMAVSHSGALAGNDLAYDALFRRYGVARADSLDELVASLLLLERASMVGPGGLATIHDSGGERELFVDAAHDLNVPFAQIAPATRSRLEERLDYGLEPENPCDAFGNRSDFGLVMSDCFAALLADDNTALGLFVLDANQDNEYSMTCVNACIEAAATTTKPVALATNYSATDHRELAARLTRSGIPVLDGTGSALRAVRHVFARRTWLSRYSNRDTGCDHDASVGWIRRLSQDTPLDEAESLALIRDHDITTTQYRIVESRREALAAACEYGFPIAMKTAVRGIAHKTDVNGVHLGLNDEAEVCDAWDDLAGRLGPRAMIAPMAPEGIDVVVGAVVDPQFGPLVVIGTGGIFVELLDDAVAMIAPVPREEVEHVLSDLKLSQLIDGIRGAGPHDRGALVDATVALSHLAAGMDGLIQEMDVNPLRVMQSGAMALDAMVVSSCSRQPEP